jgi:hypothetical protein
LPGNGEILGRVYVEHLKSTALRQTNYAGFQHVREALDRPLFATDLPLQSWQGCFGQHTRKAPSAIALDKDGSACSLMRGCHAQNECGRHERHVASQKQDGLGTAGDEPCVNASDWSASNNDVLP